MEENKDQLDDFQVLPPSDAGALSTYIKAEIDMQIATAKAYPRSLKQFLNKVETMATINTEVAESCTYALPRNETINGVKKKTFIAGPSVRLAEIVTAAYGNLRTGARVVANDGRFITAQGVCHDLESNNAVTVEVKRKITTKDGRPFSEDMQAVTGNAACAIAFRNAVYKVVPSALIQDVYEKIQKVAKGTAETLVTRRNKALDFFRNLGVKDEQIIDVLDVRAIEEIDLEKLQILSGMKATLVNKESTIAEMFTPVDELKKKADKVAKETEDGMKDLMQKKP